MRTGTDYPGGHVDNEPRSNEHRLAEWIATQSDRHNAALPLCNRLYSSDLPSSAFNASAWKCTEEDGVRESGGRNMFVLTSPIAL